MHRSRLRDYQKKLESVFAHLQLHKLKLQPNKSSFLGKEEFYLGRVISKTDISSDPIKIECIKNYPKPKNAKDIKSFLGLLSYYRRFVDNCTKIAKPLTYLLKKDIPIGWTSKCDNAYEELKNKLMNPPLLTYLHWEKWKFKLITDAS